MNPRGRRDGIYTRLPRLSPEQAARAGYRATMRGRLTAIPGAVNKVLAFLGELPPRGIAQAVFGVLSRSAGAATRGDDRMPNSGERGEKQ